MEHQVTDTLSRLEDETLMMTDPLPITGGFKAPARRAGR